MLNIKNNLSKKIFLIYSLILLFSPSIGLTDVVKKFNVSGNDRISDETIILFSGYKLNDDIDKNDLNKIIKNLYETSFFKNNIIFV